MTRSSVVTGGGPLVAVRDGFSQGVLLFGALLLAERLGARGDFWTVLGVPLASVLSFYLLIGAAVGTLAGLFAWALARATRARPAPLSFVIVIVVCAFLFDIRSATARHVFADTTRLAATTAGSAAFLALALWWARRPQRPAARSGPAMGRFAFMAAALACAVSIAWVPVRHHRMTAAKRADAKAPNVVFVLIDALRADRLSYTGYPRRTSPFIDRLASSGAVFTRAYSHGNRTMIAMPSLFTSKYPSYARVIRNNDWWVPLSDEQTTIAEMLRDAGYATFALMSNPYLKRPFGLTQGFDRVEEFNHGYLHLVLYRLLLKSSLASRPRYAMGLPANATEVTGAALAWLRRTPADAPFFCYIHYMDVHQPYLPPESFEDMFTLDPRLRSIDPRELTTRTVDVVHTPGRLLGEDDLTRLSDLYDACIRYVDSEVGRLIEAAVSRNDRPTIVIITSDHGDEFQEHGQLYHTNLLTEELIRVPLLIWRSDRPEARRMEKLVRHIDVLPTLAELTGVQARSDVVGRSLVPELNSGAESPAVSLIAEGEYCSAVVEQRWKLMRVDTSSTIALFDLTRDSGERHDVADKEPGTVKRMLETLDLYFEGVPSTGATSLESSEALLEQLRSIGYVR